MMLKNCCILIAALATLLSPAWASDEIKPARETTFTGVCGATLINDKVYYELSLYPELRLGQLALGFDVTLHWRDGEGILKEDWDELDDLANALRYLRYAYSGARPLHFKLGALDSATLGHGFILGNYSNRRKAEYYKRILGAKTEINLERIGVEAIMGDLFKDRIYGGRVYLRPLRDMKLPLINRLTIGATYVTDTHPGEGSDSDETQALTAYGLDITLPVIERLLEFYLDLAKIKDHGDGVGIGMGGNYGLNLLPLSWNWKIELRNIAGDFIPTVFDAHYEVRRPIDWSGFDPDDRLKGPYAEVSLNISDIFTLAGAFEKYEGLDPNLHAELSLSESFFSSLLSRRASASVSLDQRNTDRLFPLRKKSGTVITARASCQLSGGVDLVYSLRETYDEEENPIRTSSLATQIRF
ncbi:MAG: hypothetical protein QME81_17595 [bacterium]|nr:hypothetical protein [bacterium]